METNSLKKEPSTTNAELQTYLNNNLFPKHRQDLHEKSGLTFETIAQAGYKSDTYGWTIGLHDPWTGELQYHRTRLDQPKDGQKYTQPKDSKPYPYFSKLVDWKNLLDNPSQAIIITEGEKKADCTNQYGFITVSINGVYGWSSKKRLINPMKLILIPGRTIYICFDSDLSVNDNVKLALISLAKEAYRYGCKVKQINLPKETKGIDDFFVHHGVDAIQLFQVLINTATDPLESIFKSQEVIYSIIDRTKMPNLDSSKLPVVIKEFLSWSSESTHAPDGFIVGGFIGSASGALGKNVKFKGPGGKSIYPNLWIACIGKSGAGKTTALNISTDLLANIHNPLIQEHLDLLDIYDREYKRWFKSNSDENQPIRPKCKHLLLPTISSQEKLYESLALDHAAGLIAVPEELSIVLADIIKDRNGGYKPLLISLYGGSKVAPTMSFKSSSSLPLIQNPAVSILGASTLELMFQYFSPEDFYSGFLQRFNFILASSNKCKKPFPPPRSSEGAIEYQKVFNELYCINESRGVECVEYELSDEAKNYWIEQYHHLDNDFRAIHDSRISSSLSRINDETTFKLALIFHCLSDINNPDISKDTLIQAIYFAKFLKQSIVTILEELDQNRVRQMQLRVIDKLRPHFKLGMNLRGLTGNCRGYNNPVFDEAINDLEELGIIEIKELPNDSNNATVTRQVYLLEKRDQD